MDGRVQKRIKKLQRGLSLTSVIVAISVGVLLPVVLSTALGIVTLVIGEGSDVILLGVLTLSFAAAAIGGAVTATILVGRRAGLARLQADLLANVTHELRTPLTSIRMYGQTLQLEKVASDPLKRAECVDTILRETQWLEEVIDRLLTWRGASQDYSDLDLKSETVEAAVEEAVRRFSRMLAPGEVDLSSDIDSRLLVLHDRHAIASAILNLLVNAYKYTGEDKRIDVRVRDLESHVEIVVEDNGIGISPKDAGRIFDPFYRVDSRLRSKSSGVGLGLAIVRHQATAHRGEVYVESEEGQGTRFVFRMPENLEKESDGEQYCGRRKETDNSRS
jgi:two-component system, OmpR family, phosphate regulon sensor histidine kinase PhoR